MSAREKYVDGAILSYCVKRCAECGQRFEMLPDWVYRRGELVFCRYNCMIAERKRYDEERIHTLARRVAHRMVTSGNKRLLAQELFPGAKYTSRGLTPEQEERIYRMAQQIKKEMTAV